MASPDELRSQSKQRNWKAWAFGLALLLVIILIAQNAQKVEVDFLFIHTTTPLIFALVIAALLGAVIGYAGPRVRQRRRE